ncbi:MAG: hypothetical protein ACK41O_23380 [Runella zeae]
MITFKEYVDALNWLLVENPDLEGVQMVYSVDGEGNEYRPIVNLPDKGLFVKEQGFLPFEMFSAYHTEESAVNAICIN